MRDYGDTEVGGFGIAPLVIDSPRDLLYIEDFKLVEQECSSATVEFDDESVADFYEDMVDTGRHPNQFARIWIHTHPGNSAQPSNVDEETLDRVFGGSDWAIMFILACGGETYCRLRMNTAPMVDCKIEVIVDWSQDFDASDMDAWEEEYLQNVSERRWAHSWTSRWDKASGRTNYSTPSNYRPNTAPSDDWRRSPQRIPGGLPLVYDEDEQEQEDAAKEVDDPDMQDIDEDLKELLSDLPNEDAPQEEWDEWNEQFEEETTKLDGDSRDGFQPETD